MKAKESQYKKTQYMKVKFDKRLLEAEEKLANISQLLVERENELKLCHMKLKQVMANHTGASKKLTGKEY